MSSRTADGADAPDGADGAVEVASLQALLEAAQPRVGAHPTVADPVALFGHLEAKRRFHRDTGFGRMFHPGRVSFRENRPNDSLHVVIQNNRVAAHVDRVSPLGARPERPTRYSARRAAAHNGAGMAQDLVRLLRGRQGDHRSELDCEWVWDPSASAAEAGDLLEHEASAWSVQIEAQVTGVLDEARLRAALRSVLRRRPFERDPLAIFDCPDDATLDRSRARFQVRPAGMGEWPPMRAALARHPDGDVFMLNVNHAASDGFDALWVLRTVATAYATGEGPEHPLDFPAVGGLPVRPASTPMSAPKTSYHSAVERMRDFLARPALLAPDGGGERRDVGFHHVSLSAEETRRVVDVDRPGTSRNVLLASLHRAIGEWNAQHGTPGRRIGVLVPVNLRPPEWPEERVGNFAVTARVSTSRRHRAHRASTLKAVTEQTTRNRRARTGVALLAALDRSGLLPMWSKQSEVVLKPVTRNRLVDTALLANLGSLDEEPSFGAGAGETTHVWFSSPARAPLTLCVGAVTVAGRLHLVFRYPRRLLGADAARRFADCFVAEILGVASTRRYGPLVRPGWYRSGAGAA